MTTEAPPPTPAATVVLLRDGAASLEVLMLCRQQALAVHGGAYVFPGGKVERGDYVHADAFRRDDPDELLRALADPELAPADALALYVAALRETYEEAGILLGHTPWSERVWACAARGERFEQIVRECGDDLRVSHLVPWSRWITPPGSFTSPRRFDTRFFICVAPHGQDVRHDLSESSEAVWVSPGEALARYRNGEIKLMPPQIMTLNHLSTFADVASVVAEARRRAPYVVRPRSVQDRDARIVVYPGDPLHEERGPVMPGPTRLVFVDGRYELGDA